MESTPPRPNQATELLARYYRAFNDGDIETMVDCVSDDVEHHVNQGEVRHGKTAFREFLQMMAKHYSEQLEEIVFMSDESGRHAAAEFWVHGAYRVSAEGLPPARGQKYRLRAGTFFSLRGGEITRISTAYNLNEWIAQVDGSRPVSDAEPAG